MIDKLESSRNKSLLLCYNINDTKNSVVLYVSF